MTMALHSTIQTIIDKPLSIKAQEQSLRSQSTDFPPLYPAIPLINMTRFAGRYMCGAESLKEGRAVSRKRISTVMAGIHTEDELATTLAQRIERYEIATTIAAENILSIETVSDIHQLLSPEHDSRGIIRQHQNWVGGDSAESAKLLPPSPECLPVLLKEWQQFTLNCKLDDPFNAILVFSYFIILHPFSDGNGRLSRLILSRCLSGGLHRPGFVSPALYRLNHPVETQKELSATPKATLSGEWSPVLSYWKQAFTWQRKISLAMTEKVNTTKRLLDNALLLASPTTHTKELLTLLFEQPVVTLEYICKRLKIDVLTANTLLELFCHNNVLKRFALKRPLGTVVFSCEPIFQLWSELDALLFSDEY
ncbi:Fic family protein [Alteromonas sp. ASW11-130]|uniref:Fic family protein n=1 Tax=Alteromonas sp. ASW11-130 TaxID=3015775 RepID=UPI0022428A37|nr:Fic family protein [Alteromonas sp. ASW11-130]MCW8090891.1 Fic family protein [Alteromonas sp. ASW11-130]